MFSQNFLGLFLLTSSSVLILLDLYDLTAELTSFLQKLAMFHTFSF